MYEKVVVITPGRADEFYRRDEDGALLGELPEEPSEGHSETQLERITWGPAFLHPLLNRLDKINDKFPLTRGNIHEKIGIQWWQWAAIVVLILALVIGLLWARIIDVGFPGLGVRGTHSTASVNGTELIEGRVVNSGLRNYKDILVKGFIYDSAGQQIAAVEAEVGDIESGQVKTFSFSPSVNLGPAYRVQLDIAQKDQGPGLPWWFWVLMASLGLLLFMMALWSTLSRYAFPGLEIVAAHLIPADVGLVPDDGSQAQGINGIQQRQVQGRLVNYSRRNYERIIVEGSILDEFDRKVEAFWQYVGDVPTKTHREFLLAPKNELPEHCKVKLRISSGR